jgi:hypothetical protein
MENQFKINKLPSKYEDLIISLLNINPNFVLGGSLALYLLDIMDYNFENRIPDIDLSLSKPLTENELTIIHNFFNLELLLSGKNDYDIKESPCNINIGKIDDIIVTDRAVIIKPMSYFLTKQLIQLVKYKRDSNTGSIDTEFKIDIFNKDYLEIKNIIEVKYKNYNLRLTHPSVILSHKSAYAYDHRVGKQHKHFKDIQSINWDKYFNITKNVTVEYSNDTELNITRVYFNTSL